MNKSPSFAIYYAGDAYSTANKIMGRRSAGKAFMRDKLESNKFLTPTNFFMQTNRFVCGWSVGIICHSSCL